MSSFTFPTLPEDEIVEALSKWEIAEIKIENLRNPTADFVCSLYTSLLKNLDPLGDDPGQVDFSALQLLENPDAHYHSIRILNLYHKMRDLINSTCSANFTLKDLLSPKRDRTMKFISGIVNFIYFKEDKLNLLQPIVDELNDHEERRLELEAKIEELNKEIADHEEVNRMEQPIVVELEAEVKELKQRIESLNKQQMSLKATYRSLKDKTNETNQKISNAEFELIKYVQENSKLRSEIVQSPDKIQSALEEKRSIRAEAQNSERLAKQCYQERTSTVELYSKACKKMSKHLVQIQGLQEQVNKVKDTDKHIRRLKAQLNEGREAEMSLKAKIVERLGKVEQVEESRKALEKEKHRKHMEAIEELNKVKSETKAKLHDLEPRKRNVELIIAEADNVNSEINSVKESGEATQQKLYNKCEEIVSEADNYSNSMSTALQRVEEELGTVVADQ
ncbi:kinetochore protein NUF2 homolog [Tasmannia lanceolata]|uniref:kinetochore protein NUF2 homolog n=1 Tax=Tasmannia lanceolata TaxID=3420 RepID=UPI0040643399